MPCRDIAPRRNARRPAPDGEPGRGDVSWWVEHTSVCRRRLADDVVGRRVPSGQAVVDRRSMCLQSLIGSGCPLGSGRRAPYECEAERRGARARRVRLSYFRRRYPEKGHGTAAASRGVGRARAGSRNAPMIRAAVMSSTVRSGISELANGSGTSNPSP
jgi:hypothetical protein